MTTLLDMALLMAQELQDIVDDAIEASGDDNALAATQALLRDWDEVYAASGAVDEAPTEDVLQKLRTMRALQIEYFRTRDREILRRSKIAERELDRLLEGFEQKDIFYEQAT